MTSHEVEDLTSHVHDPAPEGFRGNFGVPATPRFCGMCGAGLDERYHPADGCNRLVCVGCGRVQYRNPIVVGAVILEDDGQVLLLRRARAPQAGTWVFPGGFVELGETVAEAAARECVEETGVVPHIGALVGVYDRPGPGIVIVVFRGTVASGTAGPGSEATEVRWFTSGDIPWAELAFDTTEAALRDWARLVAAFRWSFD
jgi:ADP-ribose pyrophosphatase YjhB (NUDIX family)